MSNEEGPPISLPGASVHRLLLPMLFLIFAAMYFLNTYWRIRRDALLYPYLFLALLVAFGLAVLGEELLRLYRNKATYSAGNREFIVSLFQRWEKSIYFMLYSLLFIALIRPLGFTLAMVIYLIGGMRIAGLDRWRDCVLYAIVIGAITYLLFIEALNIFLPEGPFGF